MTTRIRGQCPTVPFCVWEHQNTQKLDALVTPVHASAPESVTDIFGKSIRLRLKQYEQGNGALEDVRLEIVMDDEAHTITLGTARVLLAWIDGTISTTGLDEIASGLATLLAKAGAR